MKGIYGIIVISTYLFEAFIANMLFSSMLGKKYSGVKHYLILFACYTVTSFGYANFRLNFILFLAINIILLKILYNGPIKKKSFLLVILTAAMLITKIFGVIIIKLLLNDGNMLTKDDNLMLAIISKSVYYILINIICKFTIQEKHNNNGKIYGAAVTVITVYIMLMYTVIVVIHKTNLNEIQMSILFICSIGLMFSIIFLFYAFEQYIFQRNKIHELEIQIINNKHYEMTSEMYDKMRSMEHDIQSHINMMIEYAKDSNNKKILDYANNLNKKMSITWSNRLTGIKALDVVLSGKTINGDINNIELITEVQPIDLSFIDEDDICTIFSNLLNNAVESCRKSREKKIKLYMHTVNKAIFTAEMTNSCDVGPVIRYGELISYKSDRDKHGYGIKNIKQVLKKYGGYMEYKYEKENKQFVTTIQIPMPIDINYVESYGN